MIDGFDWELAEAWMRLVDRVIAHRDRTPYPWWGSYPHRVLRVFRDEAGELRVELTRVGGSGAVGHVGIDYLARWEDVTA